MKYLIPFFILVHTLCADSPTTDNSYILEPFDFIRVELFHEPDMTTETEINAQGLISLPLINSISISNLPIAQARKKIAQAYIDQKFLINPQVNIIVQYRKHPG
jgi:polysaccharide export outer membrane protein